MERKQRGEKKEKMKDDKGTKITVLNLTEWI